MLTIQRLTVRSLLAMAASFSAFQMVQAHFIFLAPQPPDDGKARVEVYFGEDATPDDPAYLKFTQGMQAWTVQADGSAQVLELNRTTQSVSASIPATAADSTLFIATHDLGVMDRGDAKFRLKYYAKTGPELGADVWTKADTSKQLLLNVIPEKVAKGVQLHVLFNGKAVEGSEVVGSGPESFDFEATTGESGTVTLPIKAPGLYSLRAKFVVREAGELEGKEYPETRHYTTLTLRVQSEASQAVSNGLPLAPEGSLQAAGLQPLEQPVTSFGGAISQGNLYIYGGHTGSAHSYSNDEQGDTLLRLNLRSGEWTELAKGPPLQGLAMVPHGDMLYRIGGFTAKNAAGDDHDLWSQDDVAAFDLKQNQWVEMPALPEPRSSFDAAVLDDTIYVIGGWQMSGDADEIWHKTAWSLDLTADSPAWKALPEPPFQRRALAVAAYKGKIYAIGGMQSEGGPTTQVDIFDPQTQAWSSGPELMIAEEPQETEGKEERGRFPKGMTGFGASAFATGGHLYVTTIKGDLQKLNADGSQWEIIGQTPTPRFFHRMLPVNETQLLIVGGASMSIGKFEDVEIINVNQ